MSQKPIHLGWASRFDLTGYGVWNGTHHVCSLPPECGTILSMTPAGEQKLIVDCQFAVVTLDLSQSPPGIKVEMLPS